MPSWSAGEKITAAKLNTITISDEQTYVPAVTNGGTVTWSVQTGSYWTLGSQLVFVKIYLAVNAAGSGASNITVAMPSSVDRSTRQALTVHAEGIIVGGVAKGGEVVFFTSGSGAVADRVRVDAGTNEGNVTGADLLAGGTLTIQGFYKPA